MPRWPWLADLTWLIGTCIAVGASHDVDVLAAGSLRGSLDGLPHAGHEREGAAGRLLLRPVRDDEERQSPGVLVAPVPGRFVRPATADDRAHTRNRLRQPGGVLAGRLALRLALVRPRPAEHPVVQPLAALAEPLAGAVVRARDVAVDGRRDPCEHLRHRTSPPRSRNNLPLETVQAPGTHRAREGSAKRERGYGTLHRPDGVGAEHPDAAAGVPA